MLEPIQSYLSSRELCTPGDRILLTVSGGIDSVVMAHLFHALGYDCALAHCNFQLRGADSHADESFVRQLASTLDMPVHVRHFDVARETEEKGISVQMAARDLRYRWFEELRSELDFDYIATAHNLDDSVESFFLNLSRGTGLRGLTGIPPKRSRIIRPLLFASRTEIENYAGEQGITYRKDHSNQETKYRRNKVRHGLLPVLRELNPSILQTMDANMLRLSEIAEVYRELVEARKKEIFSYAGDQIEIPVDKLQDLDPLRTWLYELFSPYGFTRLQCEGLETILHAETGRRLLSTSHQLYKDRGKLILLPASGEGFERYYLDAPERTSILPFPMDVEVLDRDELKEIPRDRFTACLDLDLLQFPLTIRHWVHGDYFFPLGMNQAKKLSDFFVDNKVPVPEKDKCWILASGKKIVWLMKHRIDHRFRIGPETRKVLLLRLQPDISPQGSEENF